MLVVRQVSEEDVLVVIEKYLRINTSTSTTKEYGVTALVKLSSRFSAQEPVHQPRCSPPRHS